MGLRRRSTLRPPLLVPLRQPASPLHPCLQGQSLQTMGRYPGKQTTQILVWHQRLRQNHLQIIRPLHWQASSRKELVVVAMSHRQSCKDSLLPRHCHRDRSTHLRKVRRKRRLPCLNAQFRSLHCRLRPHNTRLLARLSHLQCLLRNINARQRPPMKMKMMAA